MLELGDAEGPEGVTIWTKQNLADFLEAAKAGKFDHIVEEDIMMRTQVQCACGKRNSMDCTTESCDNLCPCGMSKDECNPGFC